jgi:predicted HicB family RNase H-like nuclease
MVDKENKKEITTLNVLISKEVLQRAKAKAALENKDLYEYVEEVLDKETKELK